MIIGMTTAQRRAKRQLKMVERGYWKAQVCMVANQ